MTQYDRTVEDVGNIVTLEHVNTRVPDQQLATLFYATGLGLTRDPYLMTGVGNMWMNVGRSQFHLPTGKAQVLRGHTALVLPNREALVRRLAAREAAARRHPLLVQGAQRVRRGDVPVGQPRALLRARPSASAACSSACPMWSSRCRPARRTASCASTARSWRRAGGCGRGRGGAICARLGRRRPAPGLPRDGRSSAPPFDGHHVAIYLADFSGPYRRLLEKRPRHRGKRPAPVPLRGHRRPRQRQGAVHSRARGAQHAPPDVRAAAGQPQSPSRPTDSSRPATSR